MMTAAPESNGAAGSCRAFPCQLIDLLFNRGILSDVAVTPTTIERPVGENTSFSPAHCKLLKLDRVDADSLFVLATTFLDGRRRDLSRMSKSSSLMSSPQNSPTQATPTRDNSCPVAPSLSTTPENAFPDIQLDTMSAGACAVYGDRCDDEAIMCTPMRACALHLRLTNDDDVVLDDKVDFGDPISHIVERYWGYFSGRYVMSISSFGKQIQALSGAVNESAAVIAELMRRLHNRVQTALRNVLVYRAYTLGAQESLEELNDIASGLNIPLPAATAHRVLIGCCIVGTKLCSDKGYKMSYYAQLGGMTLKEVCQYEKGVLDLLGYEHLFVGQEHLQRLLADEKQPEDCSYSPTPLLEPVRTLSYPTSPVLKAHRHSASSDDDVPRAHKSGNGSSYNDPCSPSDDARSNDGRAGLEATFDRVASRHKTVSLSPHTSTGRFTITNTVTGAVCRSFVAPPPLRQRGTPPLGKWATPPLRSPCTSEGVPSPIPDWSSPPMATRPVSDSDTPPLATPLIHSFQSDGYDYKSGITSAVSTDDLRSEASSVGTLQRAVRLLNGDSAGYADTVDHRCSSGAISPSAEV